MINKNLKKLINKLKLWEIKQISIRNIKIKSRLIGFYHDEEKEKIKQKIMYTG